MVQRSHLLQDLKTGGEEQQGAALAGRVGAKQGGGGPVLRSPHRSDGDQSVQGVAVFYFASLRLDADQVSEVLQVEEQQMIPKVQERQTLQGEETF